MLKIKVGNTAGGRRDTDALAEALFRQLAAGEAVNVAALLAPPPGPSGLNRYGMQHPSKNGV